MTDKSDGFSPLVSTEWLAAHRDDPNVRVLDCTVTLHPLPGGDMRAESGLAAFEAAHIPGAGFATAVCTPGRPRAGRWRAAKPSRLPRNR